MPLDPRAKRFLDTLAAMNPPGALSLSVAERRGALAHLLSFCGPPEEVGAVAQLTLPGPEGALALRTYEPRGARPGEPLPGLIYFHGGGLVAGSLDTHDPICRSLANASGCRVLSLDYRLAPEHPFPAALEDACGATAWIAAHAPALGVDPQRLGVGGDSAGATLAAVVCQAVSGAQPSPLAFQFLLCPITDFAADTESRRAFGQGYLVDHETLEHDLKYYLPSYIERADPRVSPLRTLSVAGLPPTAVHTAEFDPLRDEGQAYAEKLTAAGIPTIYRCHPGMIHLFYGMRGLLAYAGVAFELIGADIRRLLMPGLQEGTR
jgi:acetyl esterase